jgi:hypothetical protein
MKVDDHDAQPSGHTRVDDQIGGYEDTDTTPAYPGDEHDFAAEHMRPTFSDEQSDEPGMRPDESTPRNLGS